MNWDELHAFGGPWKIKVLNNKFRLLLTCRISTGYVISCGSIYISLAANVNVTLNRGLVFFFFLVDMVTVNKGYFQFLHWHDWGRW